MTVGLGVGAGVSGTGVASLLRAVGGGVSIGAAVSVPQARRPRASRPIIMIAVSTLKLGIFFSANRFGLVIGRPGRTGETPHPDPLPKGERGNVWLG